MSDELTVHQMDTIREALVATAQGLIGIPYAFGAEWADTTKRPEALDCSEFTENVYKLNGLHLPDGSQNQFNATVPTGKPLPGDLGFFGRGQKITQIYHVGMVVN